MSAISLSELIGKTLPEAQKMCPGMRFIGTESNGKFAEGEARIVRARRSGETVEVVLSKFKTLADQECE